MDAAARVVHPRVRWGRTRSVGRSSRRCGGGCGVHATTEDKQRLHAPIGRSILLE